MKRFINLTTNFAVVFIIIASGGLVILSSFKNQVTEKFKIPILINKGKQATVCLSPQYMLNAWYNIERMELMTDTLDLSKKEEEINYYQFYEDPSDGKPYNISNTSLQVIADTINELSLMKKPIWASYLFHRNLGDKATMLQDDTLIQQVKSFPIYVANLSSTKTANLETQDGSIIMTIEALDEKNKWRAIEYWSNSWCGNSYFTLNIPPKHYILTRGIKCSGDFRTKCRLIVKNKEVSILSNEFYMYINKTQFEKPIIKGE